MQKQGSIVHPLRDLANCSKLRMANVGWAEFKPHLRGSLGHGPNQHKRAVPRRGHGAKSLTQHRHAGPSANSGSVDTVPEPSGCTPLSLSSCDHRQAALSASGCECSLPENLLQVPFERSRPYLRIAPSDLTLLSNDIYLTRCKDSGNIT